MLGPGALRAAVRGAGDRGRAARRTSDREVVTSCGSGTSATHHSLAMRARRPARPDPVRRLVFGLEPIGRAGRDRARARRAARREGSREAAHDDRRAQAMAPSTEIRDTVLEIYRRMLAGEADAANDLISRDPALIFIGSAGEWVDDQEALRSGHPGLGRGPRARARTRSPTRTATSAGSSTSPLALRRRHPRGDAAERGPPARGAGLADRARPHVGRRARTTSA